MWRERFFGCIFFTQQPLETFGAMMDEAYFDELLEQQHYAEEEDAAFDEFEEEPSGLDLIDSEVVHSTSPPLSTPSPPRGDGTSFGAMEDDDDELQRADGRVLLASVIATTWWQMEERKCLRAFVLWLEFATETAERQRTPRKKRPGLPPLPPKTIEKDLFEEEDDSTLDETLDADEREVDTRVAWARWAERSIRLVRCRRLGRLLVGRTLTGRAWRRAAIRAAWTHWASLLRRRSPPPSNNNNRALAVVQLVRIRDWRRRALRVAFGALANAGSRDVEEAVTRVAAEHLERMQAQNQDLRTANARAMKNARIFAARIIVKRLRPIAHREHLVTAWTKWTTGLPAPRRAREISAGIRQAIHALCADNNAPVFRDVFAKYAVGALCEDRSFGKKKLPGHKKVSLVLPLDRLWAFAKDFAIAPAYANFPLLMQLAHDQLLASVRSPKNGPIFSSTSYTSGVFSTPPPNSGAKKRNSSGGSSSGGQVTTESALRFDQFLAVLAHVALHQSHVLTPPPASGVASAEHDPVTLARRLLRTIDASSGLAKLGLTHRRFHLPNPRLPI